MAVPRAVAPRPVAHSTVAHSTVAQSTAAQSTVAQSTAVQSTVERRSTAAAPSPPAAAQSPARSANHLPAALAFPQLVAVAEVPAARPVKQLNEPLISLESTQTVRALTAPELEDEETLRWFAIQLTHSDQAFDPDAVPNLDIFSEYRLYSVALMDQGHKVHALRLGFFSEEIAAVAVASYLATHYEKPAIRRVSVAERERFSTQRVEARKDVGETGKPAAIEITNELVQRRRRTDTAAA